MRFEPRFSITNAIAAALTEIERARGFLEAANLSARESSAAPFSATSGSWWRRGCFFAKAVRTGLSAFLWRESPELATFLRQNSRHSRRCNL